MIKNKMIQFNKKDIYFFQIDLIKGLAIISVILAHSLPIYILIIVFWQFHIFQVVSIFFIAMAITSGISFNFKWFKKNNKYDLKSYFLNRFNRIIVPFMIIFIISLIWGILNKKFYFGDLILIGYLPVSGPGNYFITLIFQFILIFPLIFYFHNNLPKLTLIILFLIDLLFELVAPHISIFIDEPYLYSACIFRYFSAIGLGLYVSNDLIESKKLNVMKKKYIFILMGFPISVIYIFMVSFTQQPFPLFFDLWNSQNIIAVFYPLMLIIVMFNLFPEKAKNIIYKLLSMIGKASYHIYLVQILFFGFGFSFMKIVNKNNFIIIAPIAIVLNISLATFLGLIFYYLENNLKNIVLNRIQREIPQSTNI